MIRLLYVSISTLNSASAHQEIEKIVKRAVVKNTGQGITGALIFADGHFAQSLEGEEARIDALMQEILRDDRHRCVTIVRQEHVSFRRFREWNLAYSGEATYIGRSLDGLLLTTEKEQTVEIDRVYSLMDNLVAS